jgi:hypothetical protein
MYGKTGTSIHKSRDKSRGNTTLALAGAALLIAILGLFTPNSNVLAGLLPANCSAGIAVKSGVNVYGTNGVDGISAYAVWLNEGNSGDEAAFLKALVGKKGPQGYAGKDGKSAYQLWLDAGNSGTSDDFLQALVGDKGVDGVAGLSAYELWLSTGQNGTLQNFLNTLVGAAGSSGSNGTNGSNGLSAYEIWQSQPGNGSKSVADFLNALKGDTGPAGANGSSGAPGSTGQQGPAGAQGEPGAQGSPGPQGSPGAAGANGICTIGVGGHYASFWDIQDQVSTQPTNGMLLGNTGSASGVSLVADDGTALAPGARGSWMKFDEAGTYNIAFSAQIAKTGGQDSLVSIWLQRYNGASHNVEYTNTNLGMANNSTELVAAWNFFVDVAAGDRVRLAWHSSNVTTIIAAHLPVSNGIDIPGTPSVIVTVNQVR